MQDLTKLQDMFMQIEPAAQKVIIDLLEILYKRNEIPSGLNIFDMQEEAKESLDNFKEESPHLFNNKLEKKAITKEEQEDMDEFFDGMDPDEAIAKVKSHPKQEKKDKPKGFSSGYINCILKAAGIQELYKKSSFEEKQNIVEKVREKFLELKSGNVDEINTLLKNYQLDTMIDAKGKQDRNNALYRLAAIQLGKY